MTQLMGTKDILEGEYRWIDGQSDRFVQSLAKAKITPGSFKEAAMVFHRHIYVGEEILFPSE